MLKLGYKASAEQFAPRELLEFSVKAEDCGFDSVMISDHFQPWRHTGGHAPYSFAWLAALGERTSRVLMGTSVVTPTFRYHPSIIAQAEVLLLEVANVSDRSLDGVLRAQELLERLRFRRTLDDDQILRHDTSIPLFGETRLRFDGRWAGGRGP